MSYNPVFDPTLPAEKPLTLSAELRDILDALTADLKAVQPTPLRCPPMPTQTVEQAPQVNELAGKARV